MEERRIGVKGIMTQEDQDIFEEVLCTQNDNVDNAVYQMLLAVTGKTEDEFPWNMSIIGIVSDAVEETLAANGIYICRPWNDEDETPCAIVRPNTEYLGTIRCKNKNCPVWDERK